jgi:predicted regulator of Ras-like GTPase activity (Roadblock/LC7/MglB family)
MKTVEKVCKELKGLDGVIGAFVLQKSRCIASSLPAQYDFNRLGQVADILARVSQMSHKAGYERSSMTFHWQRASLMSWPVGDETVLALFAAPNAVRETINISVALAVEDLEHIVESGYEEDGAKPLPLVKMSAPPLPQRGSPDQPLVDERLREIEQLCVEELGNAGKALLDRCRNKTPRGKTSAQEWLMALRTTVLTDIADPAARATIAFSHLWGGFD